MTELIAIAIAVVLGVASYVAGRSHGDDKAKGDTAKEVLDNVGKAKKVADDVRATPADKRRERLREYTKD